MKALEVRFRNRQLRRRFEEEKQAIRQWGGDVGPRYVERINFILGVETWDDLYRFQFLAFHPLHHNREGQFAAKLTGRWRLIVEPGEDERTLWVVEVEDYHG